MRNWALDKHIIVVELSLEPPKVLSRMEMGVGEIYTWKSYSFSIAVFWLSVEKGVRKLGKGWWFPPDLFLIILLCFSFTVMI